MIVERDMNLIEVIDDSGTIFGDDLEQLEADNPELLSVKFNISVTNIVRPEPAVIRADPDDCIPPEGGEFEQDMRPEDVASMLLKQLVAILPERLVLPTILDGIWMEIEHTEQRWQDDHLAKEVFHD